MNKKEWTSVPKGGAKSKPNPSPPSPPPPTIVDTTPITPATPAQKATRAPRIPKEKREYKRVNPYFYTVDVNKTTEFLKKHKESGDYARRTTGLIKSTRTYGISTTKCAENLVSPSAKNPSLAQITAQTFMNTFASNPKDNIPALLSLPPVQQQYVLANLSPHNVEAWYQLFEFQQANPKHHFLSMKDLINRIQGYEMAYEHHKAQGSLKLLEPNLIDIYDNYDTFILKPPTDAESEMFGFYFGNRPYRPGPSSPVEHSVVDKETFLRHFSVFTAGIFEGWTEWNNMVVIGGSVAASLRHVPAKFEGDSLAKWYHDIAYKRSDIDIYFYGLSDEQIQMKLYRIYQLLAKNNKNVLVIRTPYTVTFCTKFPRRHIQVVLSRWDSVQEILMEADVDCSAVAFNGNKVFTTQRGRFSYNYRCIVASDKSYTIRGSLNYESRLMKYSRRGYYIWDTEFSWDKMSDRLLMSGLDRVKHGQLKRAGVLGIRLLLIGLKFLDKVGKDTKEFFEDTDRTFKNTGLAYGPKWPIGRLRPHVEGLTVPSDYGPVPSDYKVIKVFDHNSIFNPKRDKLNPSTNLRYRNSNWHYFIFLEDDKAEIVDEMRGLMGLDKDSHHRYYYEFVKKPTCEACSKSPSFCVIDQSERQFMCKKCYEVAKKDLTAENFVYYLKRNTVQ